MKRIRPPLVTCPVCDAPSGRWCRGAGLDGKRGDVHPERRAKNRDYLAMVRPDRRLPGSYGGRQ